MSSLRRGQLHPRWRPLRRDAEQGLALLQLRIDIVEPSRTRRGGAEESPTLGKEREEGVALTLRALPVDHRRDRSK